MRPISSFCDGVSRRSFLRVGALGGLSLSSLIRAEAASDRPKSHKSVIMVYLSGGMAHQDTFDLKPDAPSEVRGEFKPIDTNVPGIRISERLPLLAMTMDKMIVIRSVVGQPDEHSSWMSYTGLPMEAAKREKRPHFGSVVAKVQGQTNPIMPSFIDLSPTMQHKPYNSPGAMMLGRSAAAVKVDGDEVSVMKNLSVPMDQLTDRKSLLAGMDRIRRDAENGGMLGLDTYHDRAFEVLTSPKLVDALDVSKESPRLRERYGKGSPKHLGDGAPLWNEQLLMARRLVEAGARVVTLGYGFWDTHGNNFSHMKQHLPTFDRGISALVEDIYARGLSDDCTVVVWGEFGRTPKINKDAGRDHWARVNFALMSGGGMKTGQVIGTTDSVAGEVKNEPVPYPSVLATVYSNLGIDPHGLIYDVANRPNLILPSSVGTVDKVWDLDFLTGKAMAEVTYQLEPSLTVDEFVDVLVRSTLAERRPTDDRERLEKMLKNADLVVTARVGGLLVGVARTLTDYAFCAYMSDLAVDEAYQRRGIGKELIRVTREAIGPQTMLVLLAAPKAEQYYPHIGMKKHESCWITPRTS